ncbi:hypothetical protein MUCCIDRAFT_113018 [Mucor lusitanicus CBS 277.49]|uniref:Uncharacterized protein n=1 Tax=Mucor lusitanicus CBS 277.49 TaxID=747725 RepID=A0A168JSE7_MUCCL|nr:hypothetical protein MUCCIDRAFT_113018 [Mucor lusitanicus CBS 277.49]
MDPDALTFDDEVANEYKQQQTAHKDDIKREPQDESYATDPFGEKYDDLDGGMIKLEEQKVLYEDENGFGDRDNLIMKKAITRGEEQSDELIDSIDNEDLYKEHSSKEEEEYASD